MKSFIASILPLAVAAAVLAVPPVASAQVQSKAQQNCINTLNKGMYKVFGTQAKIAIGCITGFAKGDETDAFDCYDFSAKVETARLTACQAQSEKCTMAPGFGPTDCVGINNNSEAEAKELAEEIFDINASEMIASCETDPAKCKCQSKALKASYKLTAARLKIFNACKKRGLKSTTAPITSESELAACLNMDLNQAIDSAIVKLQVAVDVNCTGVSSPFDSGSCMGMTGVTLIDCLDRLTRCRACQTIRFSDNLSSSTCDDYDDGVFNSSCTTD